MKSYLNLEGLSHFSNKILNKFVSKDDAIAAANTVSIVSYGAVSGADADQDINTAAIINAAAFAYNNGKTLYVPDADYYYNQPIMLENVPHIQMDGTLHFSGQGNALVLGSSDIDTHCRNLSLAVINDGNIVAENIGVKLTNIYSSNINIRKIEGFGIGVQLNGAGKGVSYNTINLERIINNYINVQLYAETSNESVGWVNENVFIGGRIAADSNFIVTTDASSIERIGISISGDGTYDHNNNNRFYGVSTEGMTVAYDLVHAQQNHILNVRTEACTYAYREQNNSYNNVIDIGYGVTDSISLNNYTGTTILIPADDRDKMYRYPNLIFSSGNLGENSAVYGTTISAKNVSFFTASGNTITPYTATYNGAGTVMYAAKGDNYIEFSANRAVGIVIDTSKTKDFLISRSYIEGYPGRIGLICYDSNGNIIQNDGDVRYHYSAAFYQITYFGGSWRLGSDQTENDIQFSVGENVAKVGIYFTGGSTNVRLKEFSIRAHGSTTVLNQMNKMGPTLANYPDNGTYKTSDIVMAQTPSGEKIGWICTSGGTSGTWQAISIAKVDVDSELSSTSTNPVQNKAVNEALENLNALVGDSSVADQVSEATTAITTDEINTICNASIYSGEEVEL